ncbi:sigma-70 family RNA polymerase sigma factor [Maribellus sp. YY47]|uniref:RNA polymerase sigma factor n=1 Tax=Maribellus sp. YY47 TaxID=2929486 RepID=UPI002001B10F|nr:sigma-70 family RNA polymerase sigma factor [Maribellus sp. YY47]MCK3685870.1 sigma-70 family RNA polymerase sigma factor [Maribellus sp. YY47]
MAGIERARFIELFHGMYSPIRNYVYFKTGDAEIAEDIAQDTFLKIWEKKHEIREETVKPLLYTIAGNLCKNRYEHQQVVFDFVKKYQAGADEITPEFELELKEFNNKLERAIGALKEKDRVVFLMNRMDGMTYNEIAKNLGLSVKAIEKRMKNALGELKQKIEYKI